MSQKQYKIKAALNRPSPFIKPLEFTHSGDKLNIGDIVEYEEYSNQEEGDIPTIPTRFVGKFKITEITEI